MFRSYGFERHDGPPDAQRSTSDRDIFEFRRGGEVYRAKCTFAWE